MAPRIRSAGRVPDDKGKGNDKGNSKKSGSAETAGVTKKAKAASKKTATRKLTTRNAAGKGKKGVAVEQAADEDAPENNPVADSDDPAAAATVASPTTDDGMTSNNRVNTAANAGDKAGTKIPTKAPRKSNTKNSKKRKATDCPEDTRRHKTKRTDSQGSIDYSLPPTPPPPHQPKPDDLVNVDAAALVERDALNAIAVTKTTAADAAQGAAAMRTRSQTAAATTAVNDVLKEQLEDAKAARGDAKKVRRAVDGAAKLPEWDERGSDGDGVKEWYAKEDEARELREPEEARWLEETRGRRDDVVRKAEEERARKRDQLARKAEQERLRREEARNNPRRSARAGKGRYKAAEKFGKEAKDERKAKRTAIKLNVGSRSKLASLEARKDKLEGRLARALRGESVSSEEMLNGPGNVNAAATNAADTGSADAENAMGADNAPPPANAPANDKAPKRRFLCSINRCIGGANTVHELKKHYKLKHNNKDVPKSEADAKSVDFTEWVNDRVLGYPGTNQAKKKFAFMLLQKIEAELENTAAVDSTAAVEHTASLENATAIENEQDRRSRSQTLVEGETALPEASARQDSLASQTGDVNDPQDEADDEDAPARPVETHLWNQGQKRKRDEDDTGGRPDLKAIRRTFDQLPEPARQRIMLHKKGKAPTKEDWWLDEEFVQGLKKDLAQAAGIMSGLVQGDNLVDQGHLLKKQEELDKEKDKVHDLRKERDELKETLEKSNTLKENLEKENDGLKKTLEEENDKHDRAIRQARLHLELARRRAELTQYHKRRADDRVEALDSLLRRGAEPIEVEEDESEASYHKRVIAKAFDKNDARDMARRDRKAWYMLKTRAYHIYRRSEQTNEQWEEEELRVEEWKRSFKAAGEHAQNPNLDDDVSEDERAEGAPVDPRQPYLVRAHEKDIAALEEILSKDEYREMVQERNEEEETAAAAAAAEQDKK